jgi:hypothetical protein
VSPRLRAASALTGAPLRRRRTLAALLLLGLSWPAVTARAADGFRVAWQFPAATPPPFSEQELDAAVAVRAGAAEDTPDAPVAVGWAATGVVRASTSQRRRAVALGDARGEEAARLVALAIVDLVRPLALPAPGGSAAASLTTTGRADEIANGGGLRDRAAGAHARRVTLALSGAVNRGATSAGFALEPTATVAWWLGGHGDGAGIGVLAQIGYGRGRGRIGSQALVVHMAPLRLGVVGRRGGWGLTLAGLARGYRTVGLSSEVASSPGIGVGPVGSRSVRPAAPVGGVLLGGHLGLQRSFGLSREIALLLAGGVDVLASAVDFRVRGQSLLRTGRLIPSLAMGLAWGAR